MYEWAALCGGIRADNLGTWCMSEDKIELMQLVGCDEKYYHNGASDFEMLAEWTRVLPLCTGMGSVSLYEKQLALLELKNPFDDRDIFGLWKEGTQRLEVKISSDISMIYQEMVEKQGFDVFQLIMNNTKNNAWGTQGLLSEVVKACERILCTAERNVVLRFDASNGPYIRPDRYHAETFWKKFVCDENFETLSQEESFVLRFQTLIEALLFFKKQGAFVTLHLKTNDALLREQLIAYLQNHHLIEGELRFGIALDEPIANFLSLCRKSDAELRIVPELLLSPADFGASLVWKLALLTERFPVGALRYGGLITDSFSMALAARTLLLESLNSILIEKDLCDEKRREILDIVLNY